MTGLDSWVQVLQDSLKDILSGFISFAPNLLMAVLIFILGWIIGAALSKMISQIIKALQIDSALNAAGAGELMARTGFKLNSGKFLGELVKWFVIVVALVASFNVLGLNQVNDFLQDVVLGYIPQVIAAVLTLLIAGVVGGALKKVVVASAKAAKFESANFLGSITKWSIWIFAFLAALIQLGIAVTLIHTLFTGVVIALALALGLSFGLGGQEAAASFVNKLRKEISDRD